MEMHAHYMGLAGPALRTAIGITAGLCFLAFGYGQGDIGGLMVQKDFRKHFLGFGVTVASEASEGQLRHQGIMDGVVVACWNIGSFVGALMTIFASDRLGRKGSIIVGLVIETIGKLVQVTSYGVGQYAAGRVIAGIGNGFIASTIPAWQAECLKTHRRGTLLLVSFGTCITFGVALAYWILYAFSFLQPSSVAWRFPVIASLFLVLPALAIVVFMPESPRWLLLKAREEEAIRVLSALNELPEDHEDIRREILQIKNAVKHMAGTSMTGMFSNGDYRYLHRVALAVLLQVMQQFTGVNLFIQYLGAMFYNQLFYPAALSMALAGACSSWFFVASLLAVLAIDRFWGRRSLTIFGASGMCLCMIFLSIFDYIGDSGMEYGYKVMTAFLFLYCGFFAVGWQGMSWMWSVELIPLSIRGPANALATAANWLSNFIVVLVTPALFFDTTWRTYIVFAVFNFVFIPILYFLYPETGGRSLEEVDVVFKSANDKGNAWFSVVQSAKEEPKWFDRNGDPTDSHGGSEKGDSDWEKMGSSSEEPSPDSMWRNPRPSTTQEAWDMADPAPPPSIRRTRSLERSQSHKSV